MAAPNPAESVLPADERAWDLAYASDNCGLSHAEYVALYAPKPSDVLAELAGEWGRAAA